MDLIWVRLNNDSSNLSRYTRRLYFHDAAIWALRNCKSFLRYEITPDLEADHIFCDYQFENAKDATLFRLRWQ